MESQNEQQLLDDYYRSLLEGKNLEVKYISKAYGKGLFSTKDIKEGEVVFFETPIISQQWTRNKLLAYCCSECMKFLGPTLLSHVKTLIPNCKLKSLPSQNLAPNLPTPVFSTFSSSVSSKNGLPYCSEICVKKCKVNSILYSSEGSDLFLQFASTFCDRYTCAGKIIITLIYEFIIEKKEIDDIFLPYKHIVKGSWLKLISNQKLGQPGYNQTKEVLTQQLNTSHSLLLIIIKQFLESKNEANNDTVKQFLSVEFYDSILGMFELNNTTIEVPSPMHKYFEILASNPKLFKESQPILGPIVTELNKKYSSIPSCSGHGLFAIHSCMNHSCEPNVKQQLHDEITQAKICITATKNIKKGEQIFISYIEVDNKTTEGRKKELFLNYNFVCQCNKCSVKK